MAGMRPGTGASNEGEAGAAVNAVTTGLGIEKDAAIMRIYQLEQADDSQQPPIA